MKKYIFATIFSLLIISSGWAQKFAFIDTDYILENIPEFQAAQMQINELSVQWQNEIEAKFAEIEDLYRNYQAEAVLLPEDMRKQREEQIIEKERKAKELQMQRFGRDGDLFKRRRELMQPLQDQIFEAVEDIASRGNYAVIFDKASGESMFYTDVRFDLSDEVLQKMGYRK